MYSVDEYKLETNTGKINKKVIYRITASTKEECIDIAKAMTEFGYHADVINTTNNRIIYHI